MAREYRGTAQDDFIDGLQLGLDEWTQIYGEAGNDRISVGIGQAIGGVGNDTLIGTSIYSTAAYWDSPGGVLVDLKTGQAQDGFGTVDTLVNIHQVHGSFNGSDNLLGSEANDTFFGGKGDDYFDGRNGVDVVQFFSSPSSKFLIVYDQETETVKVANTDINDQNFGVKTLKNIERIEFVGEGSDGLHVTVSSYKPSGFSLIQGLPIDNRDAGLNPRWAVTDLNGDGRLDVALRFDPESAFSTTVTGSSPVRFYLQHSDGSLVPADLAMSAHLSPTLVNRIVSADFNNDGKGDLVIGASGQDPYLDGKPFGPWPGEVSYVLESSGGLNYGNVNIAGLPKIFAHHVSAGDINGDGYKDIFIDSIWSHHDATSYFLLNDGRGGFSLDRSMLPESIINPKFEAVASKQNGPAQSKNIYTASALFDANGDGFLDLAVLPDGGTNVGKVFLNDGRGHFSDTNLIKLPAGPYGAGYFASGSDNNLEISGSIYLDAVSFDINNDGRMDLVSVVTQHDQTSTNFGYYRGASVQLLINTGTGFVDETIARSDFSHAAEINYSHYDTINAVDINADGFKDIMLYRSQGNADGALSTRILLNDGNGSFHETPYPVGLPEGLLIPIDSSAGTYAIVETLSKGLDSATGFTGFVTRVDSAKFDWSIGRDFFTGLVAKNQLSADIAGRWVHATNANDKISLSTGNERAYGYAGDDSIKGGEGNDYLDGGEGVDVAWYVGTKDQYEIDVGNHTVADKVAARDGADSLINIERLHFSDIAMALDINKDETGGEAYRLYKAAFDRTPDKEGLGYWINAFDHGADLTGVASSFIASPEFAAMYGANSTDTNFVTLLYNHVLHRVPDAEGKAYWLNALQHGMSKGAVLASFSESPENIAQTSSLIANGIQYQEWMG